MSVQNENELLASNQEEITVEEDVYVWLDKLFSKVLEYINESELRNRRILPNQRGRFGESHYLQRDLIVDEELKEISVEFADKDKECDVYELLLKKEIKAQFYIGGMIEGMVALRINQVVSKILAEQNLSDETVQHQEACTRLLGWIQDNMEKAKSYFPSFWQEEDQMRLLTPKAAVGMQKKAKALDELLKAMGTDKLEDIREKLEKIKRNEEFEEEEKVYNRNCFDWESDVLYDWEWSQLYSEDDFATILRQIGIEGEHYAKEQIVSYYQQVGYDIIEENSGKVVMEKKKNMQTDEGSDDSITLEVIYPDTAQYHQPGWDICVKKKENEKEEVLYLEIKTHTAKSVEQNILCISNEQMKMAAKELDNYFVLVVKYNWRERQGEGLRYYRNPVEQIAKGKMKHAEGKYKLQMD